MLCAVCSVLLVMCGTYWVVCDVLFVVCGMWNMWSGAILVQSSLKRMISDPQQSVTQT